MISLFRLFSIRHHRRHLLRALLGITSIGLGVSLFVSINTAQLSMAASFEKTVRTLAGRAEHRITRGASGIDPAALATVEAAGATAAPMIQITTVFPTLDESSILILCVDFQREPKLRDLSYGTSQIDPLRLMFDPTSILVTKALAARQGLKIGAPVKVNTPSGVKTVRVAGLVDDAGPASVFGGNVAVMGIGGAMKLFGRSGYDWIDVIGDRGKIQSALGSEYRVGPVRAKNSMLDIALDRVRALVSVSVIALLVGLFIIYLSVSIGVVERTKEIGTMRALGASRLQVISLFLTESLLLGVGGSAAGAALGFVLARLLIALTTAGVNAYVFVVDVTEITLSPGLAAIAIAIGTFTSVGAALLPSWRATTVSPLEALRPRTMGMRGARGYLAAFVAGALLCAISFSGFLGFYLKLPMWVGILGTGGTFLGAALMSPQVVLWFSRLFRPMLSRLLLIEGYLAVDNTMKYPQRTALTVIALGGALAMLVASSGMVASVRRSTDSWMDHAFPFDLSVAANDMTQSVYGSGTLPAEAMDRVRGVEGVGTTYGVRLAPVIYGESEVLIIAPDVETWFGMMRERGMKLEGIPEDAREIAAISRGEAAVVSTNFVALTGLGVGDVVELPTPKGTRRFRIAGAMEDYSWPKGVVVIDRVVYRDLWDDTSLTYIDVRVKEGANLASVRVALGREMAGDYRAFVHATADIKEFAHNVLEQAFSLTRVQVLIAMIIGFLGIVNTLLISVLMRTREIGLMRAIGMTPSQVARTVVIESLWVAAWGAAMGVAGGLVVEKFPIAMNFLRITGYVLPFTVPWGMIGIAVVSALVIGVVASWVPARRAARLNVLEAVGYE